METIRRRKSSSGDAFSFPSTPTQVEDDDHYQDTSFEFGCITPESPSSDPFKDSPADHLFMNGRLLPHAFPFQPGNSGGFSVADSNSSRNSSMSSSSSSSGKDSLTTSRSNSRSGGSGSGTSSARTSYSGAASFSDMGSKRLPGQVYGWQFITPLPSLTREASRRRRKMGELKSEKKHLPDPTNKVAVRYPLGRRLFRWFLSACKECHAIQPSTKDKVLLRPNVK